MANGKRTENQRLRLAQAAAQLMHEQGIRDFRLAKEKAAARLRIDIRRVPLPRNSEIETALAEHQRLFGGERHDARLYELRRAALEAMRLFADFHPRLVGDVLSGLATAHSDVRLHVFAEQSESFDLFLQSQGIPFDITERRFRYGRGEYRYYPAFRFAAGAVGVEAVVFSLTEIRQAPDSLTDGTPMTRAKAAEVERLLPGNERSSLSVARSSRRTKN